MPKPMEVGFKLTADGKMYKKGKRIYPNKDEYEGEFVENLKHGNGVLRYANNNKYTGEFKDDFVDGFGVYQYYAVDDKGRRLRHHRYEGTFRKGKKHGKGIYTNANEDTYTGEFENDVYHGVGVLAKANGDVYEGDWERGKASGKRIEIKFGNGDYYSGGMRCGLFNGTGEFRWRRNTGTYSGSWWKGKAHGRGERCFVNGNKFTGSFNSGLMHGDGIMSFANGDQYIGEWRQGHKHGKGVMRFANGDRYEGNFYNGFFYGYGKFVYSDGSYYEGEYLRLQKNETGEVSFPDPNGLRNGSGLRVWANGNRYEGGFRDDVVSGEGALQKFEGGKYSGDFRNGERHGMGIEEFGNLIAEYYTCPMGNKHKGEGFCIYHGQFKNNKFDGIGEFMCQDNRYYKGQWKGGRRHGQGTQSYLREGEAGDPKRMFIGGVGSLYRVLLFEGTWVDDVREGQGKATYVNGDTIEGTFVSGRAHGVVKYTFASSGAVNHAVYCRGLRESFEGRQSAKVLSTLALQFLMDDAAFTAKLESHTGVGNFGAMRRNFSKQYTI